MNENIRGRSEKTRKLFKYTAITGALLLLVIMILGVVLLVSSFFWGVAKEMRGIKFTKACPPAAISLTSTRPAQSKQSQVSKPKPLPPALVVPACPPTPACPSVQVFIQQQQGGVDGNQHQGQGGNQQQYQQQGEGNDEYSPRPSRPRVVNVYPPPPIITNVFPPGYRWRGPDYIYGGGCQQGYYYPGSAGYVYPQNVYPQNNWDVNIIYGGGRVVGGGVHWDNHARWH